MSLAELRSRASVPVGKGFRTWPGLLGTMSVTLEDADFLYGLVRAAKPTLVVECGTGLGIAARFIAEALRDNGRGRLLSFETDDWIAAEARRLLGDLPAEVVRGGCDAAPDPDLVFVDSHAGRRKADIARWLAGGYRGLVCVHDAMRGYDLHGGVGVLIPGSDGLWLGRAA